MGALVMNLLKIVKPVNNEGKFGKRRLKSGHYIERSFKKLSNDQKFSKYCQKSVKITLNAKTTVLCMLVCMVVKVSRPTGRHNFLKNIETHQKKGKHVKKDFKNCQKIEKAFQK